MIDDRHQPIVGDREFRQPLDRGRCGNGRGDEDAGHPALGEHLGLADLGAAHADRPRRELALGDVDALVSLGMRAQRDAVMRGERGHRRDIAVERVDIEHQHGRVEVGARPLLADQMVVQFTVGRHANNVSRCGLRNLPCGSASRRTAV